MRGTIVKRVQKDGTIRYAAVIRINGKPKWKTFDKQGQAEEYLDQFSKDIRDGTYREIRPGTFKEYAAHWKDTHGIVQNVKGSTLNAYISILDKHISPEFEKMAVQAISSAEINSFRAKLQKKKLTNKTIRNVLNLLNRILKNAVEDSYLRHMPIIKKPAVSRKRKGRALQPDDIQSLLANAATEDIRLVIMTAVLTGMRRAELFGLRWEDVDFKGDVIHVRQALFWMYGKHIRPAEGDLFTFQTPKSEASIRQIDLSPMLKGELRQRYLVSRKTGLVFHDGNGRPLDPNSFQKKEFTNAVTAAQIGKVRFHDLRHTFGSMKIEQGENPKYVQLQMGHSSIQVTFDTYGHLLKERKPEAAAKTDALIFGAKSLQQN